jgi:hemerythrin-like metal-binding protein
MIKIQWIPTFSVGFPPIDEQHKVIVGLYNDLSDVVSDQAVGAAETELGKYIVEHFKFEYQLMDRCKYPRMLAHHADHNRLKEMYEVIKSRDANKTTVMKIIVYKWFVEHVVNDSMDKHLGSFLFQNAT